MSHVLWQGHTMYLTCDKKLSACRSRGSLPAGCALACRGCLPAGEGVLLGTSL